MMKWLIRLAWMFIWRQKGRQLLSQGKANGILFYLKTLNVTRKTLFAAIVATLVLHVLVISLIGMMVTGTLLLATDWREALWLLFAGFTLLSTFMILGTWFLFSQRLWYRMSGAKEMVENLKNDSAA